jgi:hypothetical protein
MAVSMSKGSATAHVASRWASESLDLAEAWGEPLSIAETNIRCAEVFTYLGRCREADTFLERGMSEFDRMNTNLQAIGLKIRAKLLLATGNVRAAEDVIEAGRGLAAKEHLYHQQYHFQRLAHQLHNRTELTCPVYLT